MGRKLRPDSGCGVPGAAVARAGSTTNIIAVGVASHREALDREACGSLVSFAVTSSTNGWDGSGPGQTRTPGLTLPIVEF